MGKLLLHDMSTRRQHFFTSNSGFTCNQSLRESRLPGLWIRVECAWANTQAILSHFFHLKLHPSPLASCLPGAPRSAEVPRRLHSQEGVLSWGPKHQETGVWVIFRVSQSQRVGPVGFGFIRDSGPRQDKPNCRGLRGVSMMGTLLCWFYPSAAQP